MATLESVLPMTMAAFEAGNTVCWKSDPGIGKSETSDRLFRMLKKRDEPQGIRWGKCVLFMANSSEVRINGLPWKGEREAVYRGTGERRMVTVTDPSLPDSFITTDNEPFWNYDRILFVVEEYGQGSSEAKRAVSEMLRARGIHPFYLPEGSACLCLTNISKADGVTKNFDFLIDRWVEFELHFDLKGLIDHCGYPYHWNGKTWLTSGFTKSWLESKGGTYISAGKPQGKQEKWCTPRGTLALDRFCQSVDPTMANLPLGDATFNEACVGHVGMAAGNDYFNNLKMMLELPQIADIVADPSKVPVPNRVDLNLLLVYQLAALVEPQELDPVIHYIERLKAGDLEVNFITGLLRRDFKRFALEPAMLSWQTRNGALMALIQQLTIQARNRIA